MTSLKTLVIVGSLLYSAFFGALEPTLAQNRVLVVPDQYPTIQAAIDAAHSGDTVHVKPGTYAEALNFKDGIILEGENPDTTIVRVAPTADKCQCPLTIRNCQSGKIINLAFEEATKCDSSADTSASAITLFDSSVTIEDCRVTSASACGIYVEGANSRPVLRKNQCSNNAGAGIELTGGATGQVSENICQGNQNGIRVADIGTSAELAKNECSKNSLSGIVFESDANGKVWDNACSNNGETGIVISNTGTEAVLTNNRCYVNGADGILFESGAQGKASGNVCRENKGSGIKVDASSPTIIGNQLTRNEGYGLCYNSGARSGFQARNSFSENGLGAVGYVKKESHHPDDFLTRIRKFFPGIR